MSAKEQLFEKVIALYGDTPRGFTAQDCEAFLSLNRSVISHYLNRLCDDGKLTKEITRPVRFHVVAAAGADAPGQGPRTSDAFDDFIGAGGSLRQPVDLCRAAVNYPTGGLPMLLVGESGVGKSFLATLIHRYAVETGVIAADKPLIELNCADYANNPELLSGTLFGYVKGAFTGAERDKAGLLDDADGSFLFLDEVHRLSAENQEKLFLFMDKGYSYRLGDSRTPRKAEVRFLFATTENADHVLLTTFQRRIPITVKLPSFASRPITERISLIETFLHQEARRMGQDITVDNALITQLVDTHARGNIGALKNQIKVLCAEAYSRRHDAGGLVLFPTALPLGGPRHSMTISHRHQRDRHTLLAGLLSQILDDDTLLLEFCHSANAPVFSRRLEQRLSGISGLLPSGGVFEGVIWQHNVQVLHDLEEMTGIAIGPALHKLIYFCLLYSLNQDCSGQRLATLLKATEYTAQKAKMLTEECLTLFARHFAAERLGLMKPLLNAAFHNSVEKEELMQGVIVSHGKATASSIAGTANKLIGGYYLKAFDMPFSVNTRGIIDMLIQHLDSIKSGNGMIILVDMGSLKEIYEEIKLHLQGDLLVMNNVTTAMALDIADKIHHRLTMKEIVDSIKGAYEVEARYYAGIVQGNKIIISCISGAGVSRKLKDIVGRYLLNDRIDIVTMEYDDLKWKLSKADSALHGTKLIITTTDLDAGYIPLINVRQLLKEKSTQLWHNYFFGLAAQESLDGMIDEVVKLFTVEGVASHLSFLNPTVIIEEVESVIKQYEASYKVHFESYLRINLFMHIAAMIERLMVNDGLRHRDDTPLSALQRAFIDQQPEIFQQLIRKYRITLPLTESLMVYELMEPWITAGTLAEDLSK
ncbi:sigma 54-interacting transcriptional regulator [Sodalis sp. RH21]|uniref:sigma 54-interacting transcriptional regulator n=1 Tax=unclassified Sodalis (in: enterobacteria) TaxID=2636512 RepID=UPI0039B65B74